MKRGGSVEPVIGGKLRMRLMLFAGLVALVVGSLSSWGALAWTRRDVERQIRAELARRLAEADSALTLIGQRTAGDVERVGATLRTSAASAIAPLLRAGPDAVAIAAPWMQLAALDQLDVLDENGRVLSSGAWPERAGLVDSAALELPESAPIWERVETTGGREVAVRLRRSWRVGARTLHLVGARTLDDTFLRLAAAGEVALLIDAAGAPLRGGGRVEDLPVPGVVEAFATRIEAQDVGGWSLAGHALESVDGQRLATLVVGVDRAPFEAGLLQTGRRLAGLVAACVLLAVLAGAWLARRTARPVVALVGAVDSIARGEADYAFPQRVEDEFQELVGAFSRLHRSLELQRRHTRAAERVAAWRDIAQRVAHEVKNPLAPIRLTVENLVRARRSAPGEFDALFEEGSRTILEEVERLRRLVHEFSEYARLPLPDRRPTDLVPLLDEALALYACEPGLAVERRIDERLPLLRLDPDQIARALGNVIGNAVESMRRLDPSSARRKLELRATCEDGMVQIEVVDGGVGFGEEALPRIFEPYFTTKSGGTGLGLAMTHRIVTEHGGLIEAANRAQGGARLVIRLPLDGDPAAGSVGGREAKA